jgi:hypothetical protein
VHLRIGRVVLPLAMAAVVACGHSDPFGSGDDIALSTPFSPTQPIRLTFDNGMDRFATWSVDGSQIWYSFQPGERDDGDVCLARMPASGGSRTEYCAPSLASQSTRDVYERATPGPGGQLLVGRYVSNIGMLTLNFGWLDLATVDAPLDGRPLLSLPFNIGGVGFNHIGRIEWLSNDRVIAVAEDETVVPHCVNCSKRDTIFIGQALLDGRITATGATFTVIPGSLHASDFALSAAKDSIYFTVSEDPDNFTGRSAFLWRVPVSGGTPQSVFSGVGPLLSVSRSGSQYLLSFNGRIVRADLASGTSTVVTLNGLTARGYGTVTSTPDGCRILAEFGKPRDLTFETDIYLLTGAITACTP